MKIRGFSELGSSIEKNNLNPNGCLADTSVLLAASYGADAHNEECETAFNVLSKLGVTIYTNVSVKHEFLEFQRRITIAEALIDFYSVYGSDLPFDADKKLKAHQATHRKRVDEERNTKMEVEQISNFAKLLRPLKFGDRNSWKIVCEDFLEPRLTPVWNAAVKLFNITELKVRESDKSPILSSNPEAIRTFPTVNQR